VEVQVKFPAQFSHSTRDEQTAKGVRITVRALANNQEESLSQAIHMFSEANRRLEDAVSDAIVGIKEERDMGDPIRM
jgi:hypothetical protein